MTKEQFMSTLDKHSTKLPEEEREEVLRDFEEHFAIGYEEGKTDEEIIKGLGSPQQIAKELVATHHLDQMESKSSAGNIIRAVWAVIGLSFFNLVIVLGPFIGIVGIMFGGWVTSVAFVVSPLLYTVNFLFQSSKFISFDLFFSITLCGIGILIGILMFYVTKWMIDLTTRYLKFNINLAKGGLKS